MSNIYKFPQRDKKKFKINISIVLMALVLIAFSLNKFIVLNLHFVNNQDYFLSNIWTFVSWPLANQNIYNIIINGLILFIFGIKVENEMGSIKYFLYIVSITILSSIILSILSFIYPNELVIMGISSIIYSILISLAVYSPQSDIMFLGLVRLNVWLILLIYAGLDIVPIIFTGSWGSLTSLIAPVIGYLILWIVWKRSPYQIWKDSKEKSW